MIWHQTGVVSRGWIVQVWGLIPEEYQRRGVLSTITLLSDCVLSLMYKTATLCYGMVTCTACPYLSDLIELYIPSHTLSSSADNCIFCILNKCNKFQCAFSFSDPFVWNNLPYDRFLCMLILCMFMSAVFLIWIIKCTCPGLIWEMALSDPTSSSICVTYNSKGTNPAFQQRNMQQKLPPCIYSNSFLLSPPY